MTYRVVGLADRDGNIDYREFARQFGGSSQGSAQLIADLTAIFRQNGVNLDTAFQAFDRNNDGFISPQEFRSGLSQLGLRISDQQIEDTIIMMDPSGRGQIDRREFARRFSSGGYAGPSGAGTTGYSGPSGAGSSVGVTNGYPGQPPTSSHTSLSRAVIDDLKRKFAQNRVDFHSAFAAFDANNDGVIDRAFAPKLR